MDFTSKLLHYKRDSGIFCHPRRISYFSALQFHALKHRPNYLRISLMSAISSNDCGNRLIHLFVYQKKVYCSLITKFEPGGQRLPPPVCMIHAFKGFPVLGISRSSFHLQCASLRAHLNPLETRQTLQSKPRHQNPTTALMLYPQNTISVPSPRKPISFKD